MRGMAADSGSAARFFYCAKASKADRAESKHPTIKPVALLRWLCRLVTPPEGVIIDPFAGSGTLTTAAAHEGFSAILCEKEAEYQADIRRRIEDGDHIRRRETRTCTGGYCTPPEQAGDPQGWLFGERDLP